MILITVTTEVQSRIELLNAIIYFFASAYLIYILFVKKFTLQTDKELIRALLSGYLMAAGIFICRFLETYSKSAEIDSGNVYSVMLLVTILLLPVNYYCCTRLKAEGCSLRLYFLVLGFMVLTYFLADYLYLFRQLLVESHSKIFMAVSIILFLAFNGYFSLRYKAKIYHLVRLEKEKISFFENDIFIFSISQLFSLVIATILISGSKFGMSNIMISVFTLINAALLIKVAVHFHYASLAPDMHKQFCLGDQQEVTYSQGREIPDNIKADELYKRLLIYFEQKKPFLNSNLKIREVALYLYTNKTYLSRVINEKKRQNFNQFVNYYRIEEVKRLFNENNDLSIQELCTLSGFGSMATFSIAFRYYMGNTPADWCKDQRFRNKME